ncbi:MAG TPA: S53 family peptidase [Rhizomicrobium sp.]|jgi:subtilase family serine protease
MIWLRLTGGRVRRTFPASLLKGIPMKASIALCALLVTSAAVTAVPASAGMLDTRIVPPAVAQHGATLVGRVDPSVHLRLQVVLPMRDLAGLRSLLDDQIYNPHSVLFRHYLSVAQFTKRFGPAKSDYDAAVKFFSDRGLAVTHTYANRYLFQVEGAASDIERVLNIELNLYRHPTEDRIFMAPDREPTLALGVPVLSITGLDTFQLPVPRLLRSPDGTRSGTGSGPDGNFIGSDFRAAYYGTGRKARLTGKGQSVGLMELEGYIPGDIPLYFATFNQPLNVPVNGISVDGTKVDCGHCNDGEQTLDIDYAISMAPGLDQVQVYVAKDPVAIEERMASDDTSKQLSTSWGYSKNFAVEDPIYQEMAAQGQSWFTASGDNKTLKKSLPWPEEDANIIAVGGTDLVTNGPGGSWKSEPGWKYSAAGPSLDKKIVIEPYQLPYINAENLGSTVLRNVADVSANADFDMMVCAKGTCQGGWGGTSFSSPMWAGFAALANQQATNEGKPEIGFVSPILYPAYATNPKMTHDIIGHASGKFPAVKGYDLVGGLGSPRGGNTIKILVGD